jgi:hypothetical protein
MNIDLAPASRQNNKGRVFVKGHGFSRAAKTLFYSIEL